MYPARVRPDSNASARHPELDWVRQLRLPRQEEGIVFVAGLRFDFRYGTKWHSSEYCENALLGPTVACAPILSRSRSHAANLTDIPVETAKNRSWDMASGGKAAGGVIGT